MIKRFLGIAAAAGGLLLAKPTLAQDYIPQLGTLAGQVEAAACYTASPINTAIETAAKAEQNNKVFLPLGMTGQMCLNPGAWAGAISFFGNDERIVTSQANGLPQVNVTNMGANRFTYHLTHGGGPLEITGTLPVAVNGFQHVKVYAYPIPAGELTAAGVLQPPDGPANLDDVRWIDRTIVLRKRLDKGDLSSAFKLNTDTPLRQVPLSSAGALSTRLLCPSWPDVTSDVRLFRFFLEPEDGGRITAWVQVLHEMNVLQACPKLDPWMYVKLTDLFTQFPLEDRVRTDTLAALAKADAERRMRIEQNPDVSGAHQPVDSNAQMSAIDGGSVVIVAILLDAIPEYYFLLIFLL